LSVYWHPFEIWCKGIKNFVDLNSSSPANAPGASLFKHETIDVKGEFPNVMLSATFPLSTTVIPRIHPAYKVTKELDIDNTEAGLVQWYSTLDDIPAGFGHNHPTPAPTHDAAAIALAVAAGIRSADAEAPTTSKANSKKTKDIKYHFRLFYAHNKVVAETGTEQLIPAKLSDAFTTVLDYLLQG
jgi:hypothetical protein